MNDFFHGCILAEERKRELEIINHEAWKFETLQKQPLLLKKWIRTKKVQKQAESPCCA